MGLKLVTCAGVLRLAPVLPSATIRYATDRRPDVLRLAPVLPSATMGTIEERRRRLLRLAPVLPSATMTGADAAMMMQVAVGPRSPVGYNPCIW